MAAIAPLTGVSGHECGQCAFVASAEDIYINPQIRTRIFRKPDLVGIFTLPGWTGHAPFYLFTCRGCREQSIDYAHGYTSDGLRNGLLFLSCNNCRAQSIIYSKQVYEVEEIDPPLSVWQILKQALKLRFSSKI